MVKPWEKDSLKCLTQAFLGCFLTFLLLKVELMAISKAFRHRIRDKLLRGSL